jgi:hypothetical protein
VTTLLALAMCLLIAAVGFLAVVSPPRCAGLMREMQSASGLYFAAASRVVFGGLLILVAPTSRASDLLQILGGLSIVGGVVIPLLGLETFTGLIDWFLGLGPTFIRGWGVLAIVLAGLLMYAVVG